jgi:hypothetical protein
MSREDAARIAGSLRIAAGSSFAARAVPREFDADLNSICEEQNHDEVRHHHHADIPAAKDTTQQSARCPGDHPARRHRARRRAGRSYAG